MNNQKQQLQQLHLDVNSLPISLILSNGTTLTAANTNNNSSSSSSNNTTCLVNPNNNNNNNNIKISKIHNNSSNANKKTIKQLSNFSSNSSNISKSMPMIKSELIDMIDGNQCTEEDEDELTSDQLMGGANTTTLTSLNNLLSNGGSNGNSGVFIKRQSQASDNQSNNLVQFQLKVLCTGTFATQIHLNFISLFFYYDNVNNI